MDLKIAEMNRMELVIRAMVRLWRERWLLLQPIPLSELDAEKHLEDLLRPGVPAQITADQRCHAPPFVSNNFTLRIIKK